MRSTHRRLLRHVTVGWIATLLLIAGNTLAGDDTAATADAKSAVLSGGFWNATTALYGDGRPAAPPSPKDLPQGFRNDYAIVVPTTGWYELILAGAGEGFRHDVFVDGVSQWRFGQTDRTSKAGNLWLTAGSHTLRIQRLGRVGYPKRIFDHFELRPGSGPQVSIQARKTLVDVVRAGESLKIEITAGGPASATYELFSSNLLKPGSPAEAVAAVSFAAADRPTTQTVLIPCPAEGVYHLSARSSNRDLTAAEFGVGDYAVVNVAHPMSGNGQLERVVDVDCVAQTVNAKPIEPSAFIDCNGPSRVVTSSAGTYRESHDCLPPEAPVPPTAVMQPICFSGFSYRVALPQAQVPYLVEVEYPDDQRRSVSVSLNSLNPKTGETLPNASYNGKSFETGGMFPISGKMVRHTAVIWPKSESLLIAIFSQSPGYRAAAARIRVSRFEGDRLPLADAPIPGGRTFVHWYEEANSWRALVNVTSVSEGIAADFVGLDRWAQLARFHGVNGISGLGVGYQDAFFRTTTLDGMMPAPYDACRLMALICEKYRMRYVPEVYFAQWYLENINLKEQAGSDDDWRAFSAHGAEVATAAAPCLENPLHPAVQAQWINALGELSDKLRDSPAFGGITVRCDEWGFRGEYTFASIDWGYGDWTIRAFEKDNHLTVPGGPNDAAAASDSLAARYVKRYEFLTSPQMKPTWLAWRCGRILDYHQRIRDRIRGDRRDIFFGIAGNFDADPVYAHDATYRDRAAGAGVDLDARRNIDGLALMPLGHYGTRNMSAADRATYDDFFDESLVQGGMGTPRAFGAYMTYQELATYWPAAALGIKFPNNKPFYYCSAVVAAGRNFLEKYAIVLAEQDTALLRDGGNTDVYGDPAILKPWLAEYEALPAVAFEPLPVATDPIAIWSKNVSADDAKTLGIAPGLYFCAVNREQYAVSIDINVGSAGNVRRLGTGESIDYGDGTLHLDLMPYELRSFHADRGQITGAKTIVPTAQLLAVRQNIAFAQHLLEQFNSSLAGALSADELKGFADHVNRAWDELSKGHVWRARVTLQDAAMMRAYAKAGPQPAGLLTSQFPRLLTPTAKAGHWNLIEPFISATELQTPDAAATLAATTDFNPSWTGGKVLATTQPTLNITLNVPADGEYAIHLGHVAKQSGVGLASIAGQSLSPAIETSIPAAPDTTAFATVALKAGPQTLTIDRPGGIGVYGLKLLPKLRPMPDEVWAVAGPFPSLLSPDEKLTDAVAKRSLERVYPPETDAALDRVYQTDAGNSVSWTFAHASAHGNLFDRGVNMPIRVQSSGNEVDYARTVIHSDRPRTALVYVAAEWWARAYLNGQRLMTNIDPKVRDDCGADFMTFYPSFFAVMQLNAGDNVLLVKQHGGSLGSAMAAFITDDAGITFSAKPQIESHP